MEINSISSLPPTFIQVNGNGLAVNRPLPIPGGRNLPTPPTIPSHITPIQDESNQSGSTSPKAQMSPPVSPRPAAQDETSLPALKALNITPTIVVKSLDCLSQQLMDSTNKFNKLAPIANKNAFECIACNLDAPLTENLIYTLGSKITLNFEAINECTNSIKILDQQIGELNGIVSGGTEMSRKKNIVTLNSDIFNLSAKADSLNSELSKLPENEKSKLENLLKEAELLELKKQIVKKTTEIKRLVEISDFISDSGNDKSSTLEEKVAGLVAEKQKLIDSKQNEILSIKNENIALEAEILNLQKKAYINFENLLNETCTNVKEIVTVPNNNNHNQILHPLYVSVLSLYGLMVKCFQSEIKIKEAFASLISAFPEDAKTEKAQGGWSSWNPLAGVGSSIYNMGATAVQTGTSVVQAGVSVGFSTKDMISETVSGYIPNGLDASGYLPNGLGASGYLPSWIAGSSASQSQSTSPEKSSSREQSSSPETESKPNGI